MRPFLYLLAILIFAVPLSWHGHRLLEDSSALQYFSNIDGPLQNPTTKIAGCTTYQNNSMKNRIPKIIQELSGLESVPGQSDRFYMINDSLNEPLLHIGDSKGQVYESIPFATEATDTEDVAIGPCFQNDRCVFIADTGDNLRLRPEKTIFFKRQKAIGNENSVFQKIRFQYEGDVRLDAETFMVHPKSGNLYVVSKGPETYVYRIPTAALSDTTILHTARLVTRLNTPWAMGGDIHGNGQKFLLTSKAIYEYTLDLDQIKAPGIELDSFKNFRNIPAMGFEHQEAIAYIDESDGIIYGSEKSGLWEDDASIAVLTCRDSIPML